YTSPSTLPAITITGKGWLGDRDKFTEINVSSPANANRQEIQFVLDNFTESGMAFIPNWTTFKSPETIQLPDLSEISSTQWSVTSPSYRYIIVYPKDSNKSGGAYQAALLVIWQGNPSSVTVDWNGSKYYKIHISYSGSSAINETIRVGRITMIDPSASLDYIHAIASHVVSYGTIGMKPNAPYAGSILDEEVAGFPAGAYILCKYDAEEDNFGGDYADFARNIATKVVDDKIAMWSRGRKSDWGFQEFITGAYFLCKLYDLPNRFHDATKRDYYYNWMCTWANDALNRQLTGSRMMIALWRAYLLSGDTKYKNYVDSYMNTLGCSASTGLTMSGVWKAPNSFYNYGEVLALLGQRATSADLTNLGNLLTYLNSQKRATDQGYLSSFWEPTVEQHNFFGRWCKGLGMGSAPKQIIDINEFPIYYKSGSDTVVQITNTPSFYNPGYWNQDAMENYLKKLPHKLAKSVLFRINNILLKTDYHNNWFSGTKIQSVIDKLNTIKSKTTSVLDYIDNGVGDYNTAKNLLVDCDSLYASVQTSIEPNFSLPSEVIYCKRNHDYLKAVLPNDATARNWDDGGTGHSWGEVANWSDNVLPTVSDTTYVNVNNTHCEITSGIDARCSVLRLGWNSGITSTLDMSGGTLTISGDTNNAIGY
ncbi:MAG: hypothetical protein ABFD79_03645, partial [Phycisphaerales bacterium]